MTTKKKKKNTMNAIDKYLMQKRYSEAKKYETIEKRTKKVMQVVVPKVSREVYATVKRSEERKRRPVRLSQNRVPERTDFSNKLRKWKPEKNAATNKQSPCNLKKSLKVELPKLPKGVLQKTSRATQKLVENPTPNQTKNTRNKNHRVNQKHICENEGKHNNEVELPRSKRELNLLKLSVQALSKKKRVNVLRNHRTGKNPIDSEKSQNVIRTAKSVPDPEPNLESTVNVQENDIVGLKQIKNTPFLKNFYNGQKEDQVTGECSISEGTIISDGEPVKKTSENANRCLPKKRRKFVEEIEISTASSSDAVHEPSCSSNDIVSGLQDGEVDNEITEEITPITKKYQPYMERLKFLSFNDIEKYIKDNQQYYVDYKKEIESRTTNIPSTGKKTRKYDETKENFKCNPFSSDQQLAMYYTLREIFDVPKTHFMECRTLFTVLLPEISCQLFAETFRIKVSFAPRLIKKLYPNPVCPV